MWIHIQLQRIKKDAKIIYKWIEVYPLFGAIHTLDSLSLLQIIQKSTF